MKRGSGFPGQRFQTRVRLREQRFVCAYYGAPQTEGVFDQGRGSFGSANQFDDDVTRPVNERLKV
jgi:hypothetical protein